MKKINIIYWVSTIIAAGLIGSTGIPNIMLNEDTVKFMSDYLHYPNYFTQFLGVAKLLGAIGIIIPCPSRIKEWAYAGLFFDLIGATYSQIAIGAPAWGPEGGWILMALFFLPLIVSYIYFHKRLKLLAMQKA